MLNHMTLLSLFAFQDYLAVFLISIILALGIGFGWICSSETDYPEKIGVTKDIVNKMIEDAKTRQRPSKAKPCLKLKRRY